ncbi:hypothetical protein UP15_03610 [Bacillus pumilus]|nr:hypothetical protein UP15_03610 [Bacillus pumilus]
MVKEQALRLVGLNDMEKDFLTLRLLSKLLDMSKQTIYKLAQEGVIPEHAYTESLVHHRKETTKFLSDSELYKIRKKYTLKSKLSLKILIPLLLQKMILERYRNS